MTSKEFEKFSIPLFIERLLSMNRFEALDYCNNEKKWAEEIITGKNKYYKEALYDAQKYHDVLSGVGFLLHSLHPVRPGGMKESELQDVKPIFVHLVDIGDIPQIFIERLYPPISN